MILSKSTSATTGATTPSRILCGALVVFLFVRLAAALPPPVAQGIKTDVFGRVVTCEGSMEVPLPRQGKGTAVFLIIGQSNAANYASRAFRSEHGAAVANYFAGKAYIASSPLLGSDGPWGEYWTEVANRLVEAGVFKSIILVSSAIGGTSVKQWEPIKNRDTGKISPRNDLNAMLMAGKRSIPASDGQVRSVWPHRDPTPCSRLLYPA